MARVGGAVEHAWSNGSYRMEVWMTGATAQSLLFLHDKDLLVLGEGDGTVRVLYEKTRGPTTVQKAHAGAVTALVSVGVGQGNLFVSAGVDRVIRLWGPEGKSDGHFRVVHELRVSPGDEHEDNNEVSGALQPLPKPRRSGLAPDAATTGDALFCLCGGQRLVMWGPPEDGDAEDRVAVLDVVELTQGPMLSKLFDLRGHSGGVKCVESGGDDEIVTLDALDTLRVFSTRTRSVEATIRGEADSAPVQCMLCIREHAQRMTTPLLLLGRQDGSIDVRAWPTAGGARIHKLPRHSGRVTHMQHIGEIVISAGHDAEISAGGRECVRFCNAGTGRLLGSFTTAPVTCMSLRTDSRTGMRPLKQSPFALTGHIDGKAILWDVVAQRSLHILDGHHKAVRSVHANRFCAVSGGEDSTCRVWRFVDDFVLKKEEEEVARAKRQAKEKAEAAAKAYKRRNFEHAVALYSEAIDLDSADLLLVTNRAAVHLESGDLFACIVDCNRALDAITLKGLPAAAQGVVCARDAPESEAHMVASLHEVALGTDARGDEPAEAESRRQEESREVEADRKVLARAHGRKGAALAQLGQVEEAIAHLQASLNADAAQPLVRQRLLQLRAPGDALVPGSSDPGAKDRDAGDGGEMGKEDAAGEQPGEVTAVSTLAPEANPVHQDQDKGAFERCEGSSDAGRVGAGEDAPDETCAEAECERVKGGEAYRARQFQKALVHYSNAVRLQPANALHWSNRSAVHFETNDLGACVGDCDEALARLGVAAVGVAASLGGAGAAGGSFPKDAHSGALKLDELRGRVLARRAKALRKLGGMGQVEGLGAGVRAAGEHGGSVATSLSESAGLGRRAHSEGDGDEGCAAASRGRDTVEKAAGEGEGREEGEAQKLARKAAALKEKERGNEMFKGRRYGDAIEYYDKALELDAALAPLLLLNRAVAHSERGSYLLATADFDRALGSAQSALAAAKTGARIVDVGAEEAAAAEVAAAADQVCKVLTRKGRMLEKKAVKGPKAQRVRGLKDALKCLEEARTQQPADTSEAQRGTLDEAIQLVRDRLHVLQQDDVAKEEIANGDRMFADGQHAAAVKFYDRAEKADPKGERSDAYLMYSNRGGCLLELKRYRQALADAERCVALKPSWVTGHMLVGRVHEALEQWPEMLTACCRAYDIDATNETNLAMLRDCLIQHLTNDSLRQRPVGSFSDALGRAREDSSVQKLIKDPQVVRVTMEMQRTRDLTPLATALEDLPLAGKLAKLLQVGLLVPGM